MADRNGNILLFGIKGKGTLEYDPYLMMYLIEDEEGDVVALHPWVAVAMAKKILEQKERLSAI